MKDYENMTVKELVEELTSLGVSFNKKSRKAELIELLKVEAAGKDTKAATKDKTPEVMAVDESDPIPKIKKGPKAQGKKAAPAYTGYAIVRTGGKQYRVSAGSLLRVEKISGNVGDTIELTDVLAVVDGDTATIGQPKVEGAVVTARIIEQDKAKKVLVFKKKRRKGYRVKRGHRQMYTALEVSDISV